MLGRFLEVSVETRDIRESVAFWERLGFSQCQTGDTWTHPYGVLTDGRIAIGLLEYRFPSPALTFVHAGLARHAGELESAGFVLAFRKLSDDAFNEVGLRDPARQMIAVLEARTYSPAGRDLTETSLLGAFAG